MIREVGGRRLALSSLDKVLWPSGFTKGEMLDYYERVAAVLLPHLRDRPLTLGRFPDGVDGPGFAQTECRGAPEWVETAPLRLRDGTLRNYCLVNDLASLLWVVNLGTIELHPFLAPVGRLDRPSGVVFDLDPEAPAGLHDCARVALLVRDALAERGLDAVAKSSGSAGVHVLAPLDPPRPYAETRRFARELAERLAAGAPGVVARAGRREERVGTVLIDWAQNSERRSTVAAYSLRAADRPLVSAPVAWEELEAVARSGDAAALELAPAEVLERVARSGDLYAIAAAR